ncbi:tyrosine-type recombinase/integrase [Delftia tsuruhatensis]|uniref:tyrosine-type recombinase/integrase n=1 Tax=Delftia tsuruhatensis TaxID=180282 RepID=UPI002090D9B6|nr:integrase arm-type DNA-binding domain-containing protein [Delftia tsuruhatensis]MCO5335845.1 integrase arm-type DNA-binding domain-containing protein [Delftia tsuruhatensis]MCR4544184.1 integrase arm-type DNA-binding domain-containing protein [Delftia tsuruhatensis]
MPLTDTFVKTAKPDPAKTAGSKFADGYGLFLLVKDAGKYWRMAYRFAGKQKTLALGTYPSVTLAQARKRREEARAQLAAGIDPGVIKQAQKVIKASAAGNTFEAIAREFHETKRSAWSDSYSEKWLRNMVKDLFPHIGRMPLPDVTPPILLGVLRKVEKRGANETAHTLRQIAGQVFRYGIQTGRCEANPVPDLHGALEPVVVKHMAAVLEPQKAGELLRAVEGYQGQPTTKAALQLSALLFQRPGNIRAMEWTWVDLDAGMLTIPSQSMKRTKVHKLNGRPHFVPLAPQAIAILRELVPVTGHGKYVFPSLLTGERPMSENTVNTALRRLGFTGAEMTAHGFRAMARTLMVERLPGVQADVIEAQLAHGKSGPLGAAYDRADYMGQRRHLMRTWADYLDQLRLGKSICHFTHG